MDDDELHAFCTRCSRDILLPSTNHGHTMEPEYDDRSNTPVGVVAVITWCEAPLPEES